KCNICSLHSRMVSFNQFIFYPDTKIAFHLLPGICHKFYSAIIIKFTFGIICMCAAVRQISIAIFIFDKKNRDILFISIEIKMTYAVLIHIFIFITFDNFINTIFVYISFFIIFFNKLYYIVRDIPILLP